MGCRGRHTRLCCRCARQFGTGGCLFDEPAWPVDRDWQCRQDGSALERRYAQARSQIQRSSRFCHGTRFLARCQADCFRRFGWQHSIVVNCIEPHAAAALWSSGPCWRSRVHAHRSRAGLGRRGWKSSRLGFETPPGGACSAWYLCASARGFRFARRAAHCGRRR